jgi:hypothetical protein
MIIAMIGARLPKVDPISITKIADIRIPIRPSYSLDPVHVTGCSDGVSGDDDS